MLGAMVVRFVFLVVISVVATDPTGDPCSRGTAIVPAPVEGLKIMSWKDADACLSRVNITAEFVYETLAHLKHGLVDVYSFEGIASDSQSCIQSVTGGCKMAVHPVMVNLRQEIQDIETEMTTEVGARSIPAPSSIEDLLKTEYKNLTVPAKDFHGKLETLFRRLNDAHTQYYPPWFQSFVMHAYVEKPDEIQWGAGEKSRTEMRLEPVGPTDAAQPPNPRVEMRTVKLHGTKPQEGPWKEVVSLNNENPFDYLVEKADTAGVYKSHGARLNSLMNSWGGGMFQGFPLDGSPLNYVVKGPGMSEEKGTLEMIVWALKVSSSTELQDELNHNPNWEVIEEFLHSHIKGEASATPGMLLQRRLAAALQGSWPEPAGLDTFHGHESNLLRATVPSRRLLEEQSDDVEEIGHFPRYLAEPILVGYKIPGAVVLKVSGFMPASRLGGLFDIGTGLIDLVKLYRKVVRTAESQGTDRLIIDLSDNGGGVVEYANLLMLLVAPRHHNKTELCADYAVFMNSFWQKWLTSFGEFDEAELDQDPVAELEGRFQALYNLKDLAESMNGVDAGVNFEELKAVLQEASNQVDDDSKRKVFKDALKNGRVVEFSTFSGTNSTQGWYPFKGDVEDPETGEPFDPPLKPYKELETHQWGVTEDKKYSGRFQFACNLAFSDFESLFLWFFGASITKAKHQWKEIAVLSNGLCGSACSLFATQLQFKEGATTFTYGGIPGKIMDMSAFAGGNVEEYKNFWPQALYASLVGDALHGPNTEIGQMMRSAGSRERSFARTLLLPLPTKAMARFNHNMMFVKEFGPDALPREWYIIAAHRHFWEWHDSRPHKIFTQKKDWCELCGLYKKVAAENWTEVRKNSVAPLGLKGISYVCAAEPPTIPFEREEDWDRIVYPILIPVLIVLCCCCTLCCWGICCKAGLGQMCYNRCFCCCCCCGSCFGASNYRFSRISDDESEEEDESALDNDDEDLS